MKAFSVILKIVAALNLIAGAIYILATYGEQIVAWCKKFVASAPITFSAFSKCCNCNSAPVEEAAPAEEVAPVEEVAAEEAPVAEETPVVEETVTAEEPAQESVAEIVVPENEPVAEDSDFAE